MGWNVPDDWNCYWRKCPDCGHKYHASEGGCDCHESDDEDGNKWVEDGIRRVTVQVARKDYGTRIKKGDTYRKTVTRGYWDGGAWGPWQTSRELVKKAD